MFEFWRYYGFLYFKLRFSHCSAHIDLQCNKTR